MPDNQTPQDEQKELVNDVGTIIFIVKKHVWVFTFLFLLISISVTAGTTAINYFAKKDELIIRVCERMAEDLDSQSKIDIAMHDGLIILSTKILNMFKKQPKTPQTDFWVNEFTELRYGAMAAKDSLKNAIPKKHDSDWLKECKIKEAAK